MDSVKWRVIGQTPRSELNQRGQFVDMIEVTFELLPTGTTGTVKVPLSQYTEEYVQQQVHELASRMWAVENLAQG